MDRMDEMGDSPLILSEGQKADRLHDLAAECGRDLFPPKKREFLKHLLEEMSFVFSRLKEKEYASLSLSAARTVSEIDAVQGMSPVVHYLIERSLRFFTAGTEEEVARTEKQIVEPGGIIVPHDR
jgi:hypothetical protein